jgi:dolichyl-phosphate beta-glucosyltransferase
MNNCIIVVPCYNEADRLNSDAFKTYLEGPDSASVIFVNDGSTDQTLALLKRFAEEMPAKVRVFDKQPNAGKAEAVRYGMLQALNTPDAAYIGFWDADLATPLDAVADLLGVLISLPKVEIVLGSRVRLMGRHIERQPARHYLGRVFATFASIILGLPLYDTQCGAKLFRVTPSLVKILDQPFLSRWIFDVEMIARFVRLHPDHGQIDELVYEFPLYCWRDIPGSKLRSRDFYRAIGELWTIKRTYFSK